MNPSATRLNNTSVSKNSTDIFISSFSFKFSICLSLPSMLPAGQPRNRRSNPGRGKRLFILHSVQNSSGTHPDPYSNCIKNFWLAAKLSTPEADHSSEPRADATSSFKTRSRTNWASLLITHATCPAYLTLLKFVILITFTNYETHRNAIFPSSQSLLHRSKHLHLTQAESIQGDTAVRMLILTSSEKRTETTTEQQQALPHTDTFLRSYNRLNNSWCLVRNTYTFTSFRSAEL